jgi:transposase InsO family protein
VQQAGRNLIDCYDGFLRDTRYLLLDRDKKFLPLRCVLKSTDTKEILLPPKSPNSNAHIDRYMRSLKSECLERMVFFGERSLRHALAEFVKHYHEERNHQGLGNRLIEPSAEVGRVEGEVACRNRLGGLLRYYDRDAIYGDWFRRRVKNMGIEQVLTAPQSQWQNPYSERLNGSVRRECLDHMIVLSEAHLKRILARYVEYHNRSRTHLSLEMDSPATRPVQTPGQGKVISVLQVGGLHHRYERRAA